MAEIYDLPNVDAFTTGTLGRPGERTFFLQARAAGHTVSVQCEKQQVDALSTYLGRLLEDLPTPPDRPHPDALDLAEPVLPAFVLGSIGVAFDEDADLVVLHLEELVVTGDAEEDAATEAASEPSGAEDAARLHVRITRGQARAFCDRAAGIVAAGRPACRFCGLPIDIDGHICPRMN